MWDGRFQLETVLSIQSVGAGNKPGFKFPIRQHNGNWLVWNEGLGFAQYFFTQQHRAIIIRVKQDQNLAILAALCRNQTHLAVEFIFSLQKTVAMDADRLVENRQSPVASAIAASGAAK